MRVCVTVLAALGAWAALPATAQSEPVELSAPKASETEKAAPEWYRQFTLNSPSEQTPIWQGAPSKQVKLAWIEGEKWQLSVDLTSRPDGSPLAREEMRAGADFRITPRISVGGVLTLGANDVDQSLQSEEIETGIRLRSAFKF
jgi:hypothetical protein